MKIDFHAHAFTQQGMQALKRHQPDAISLVLDDAGELTGVWAGTPLPCWNAHRRLQEVDAAGIDLQLLNDPTVYTRVDRRSPEICRAVNDALAGISRADPDRFRFLASVPFNSVEAARTELDRAADELGAVGLVVGSNAGGRYLHEPELLPFWQAVERRGLPVLVHPLPSPFYRDDEAPVLLCFPFDTTLAALKLVYSGLLERCPGLVLVLSHLGGALPALAHRIAFAGEVAAWRPSYAALERPPIESLRRLYVDTAFSWNRGAFECARDLVGIDRIVYGSDYFLPGSGFLERTSAFVEGLGLTPVDREKVFSENARRLLGRLD